MTKEELDRIPAAHKAWLNNEPGGNRADLRGANLSVAEGNEEGRQIFACEAAEARIALAHIEK